VPNYNDYKLEDFPIGYVRCTECDRPALWLYEDTASANLLIDEDNTVVSLRVGNILLDYPIDETDTYYCDSCGCSLGSSIISSEFIYFLPKDQSIYVQ